LAAPDQHSLTADAHPSLLASAELGEPQTLATWAGFVLTVAGGVLVGLAPRVSASAR
jgi:hypothetical protein